MIEQVNITKNRIKMIKQIETINIKGHHQLYNRRKNQESIIGFIK